MQRFRIPALAAFAFGATLSASLAVAAEPGSLVYIPTGAQGEVVIVDAATNEPIGQIGGLPAAHGLAVTPDGRRLVVGSLNERAPGEAAPERPAGMSEADHAAHHAGAPAQEMPAAVSSVSIVDTESGSVVQRIDVPGAVHHVAMSPDGRFAAVTHPNAGAITALDLDALAVIATVPTGDMPNYAVFSADGSELYVSNAGDDALAVLDVASWAVTGSIGVGASPEHIALSPDGSRLVVNNVADGSVSVIDTAAREVIETIPVGIGPHGIDFADDGNTVFVSLRGEDRLIAIDLADGTLRSAPLSPAPYHLKVLGGRGVLYVSSAETSKIRVIDATTLEVLDEFDIPGIGHQFGLVPGS